MAAPLRSDSLAPSRRMRTGAAAVFQVPSQRLAVVDLAAELGRRPAVTNMSVRLGWGFLHLTDSEQLIWALRVNRPAAVLVLLPSDLPPDVVTVERARRAARDTIAVMGEVSGPQSAALPDAGAEAALRGSIREEEPDARMLAPVRRAAEGSDAGDRYLVSGPLLIDLWQREATLDTAPLAL